MGKVNLVGKTIFMGRSSLSELLKVLNVHSILNQTFQMVLKSAVVSTNSNTDLFSAGTFKDRTSSVYIDPN